jgi:hypothetical protein
MTLAACLILYFAPPIVSCFGTETMVLYNRVWLFNLVWILFWPVMIFVIWPQRRR